MRRNVKEQGAHLVPNIDYSLCTGCGGCAEIYPVFFQMRDDKAWAINTDRFNAEEHQGILTVCPYHAISLEEV